MAVYSAKRRRKWNVSVSALKSAPEEIRRIFVFTQEEKKQLLEQAEQAVLLATL